MLLIELLSIFSFAGYHFTNKWTSKFYFKLPLDNLIKVYPIFVIPYVALFPYLVTTYLLLRQSAFYKEFLLAMIVVNTMASLFWYLIPNGVKRIRLNTTDVYSKIINWLYKIDHDTNAFPSGHVLHAVLCAYYLSLAYGKFLYIWILLGSLISVSTIFTKQHYVIDIFGGIIFTVMAIFLTNFFLI